MVSDGCGLYSRWPGRVNPGCIDRENFICGTDFMPTILEACGLPQPAGMDGRSFLPLLTGEKQSDRNAAFTVINTTSAWKPFPMRGVQTRDYGYIYNDWSDGKTVFKNESMSGLTYKAMQAAGATDAAIAGRVRMFDLRAPEELYDLRKDPDGLNNLIADPRYGAAAAAMRRLAAARMTATRDPLLPSFERKVPGTG